MNNFIIKWTQIYNNNRILCTVQSFLIINSQRFDPSLQINSIFINQSFLKSSVRSSLSSNLDSIRSDLTSIMLVKCQLTGVNSILIILSVESSYVGQ